MHFPRAFLTENHRRMRQSLDYQALAEVYLQTATAHQKQTAVIKSTLATKGEESTLNGTLLCLDFGFYLSV